MPREIRLQLGLDLLLSSIHEGDGSRIQHRRPTLFDLRFCIKTVLLVPVRRTATVQWAYQI